MSHNRRLGVYLLVMLALFGAGLMGPRAWATTSQMRLGQGISVPTATPVREWSPAPPTAVPPTDPPSGGNTATPVPPRATPAPTARPPRGTPTSTARPPTSTPVPTAATPDASSSGAALALVKGVNRLEAWPGATVWFTLIVSNPGAASARQIVLEDTLPAELEPGTVQETSAAWDGRTLRGLLAVLPPGGQWEITFSAIVREDASDGKLVANSAQVWAAGGLNARGDAYLALPPAELPAVGGGADELRLP